MKPSVRKVTRLRVQKGEIGGCGCAPRVRGAQRRRKVHRVSLRRGQCPCRARQVAGGLSARRTGAEPRAEARRPLDKRASSGFRVRHGNAAVVRGVAAAVAGGEQGASLRRAALAATRVQNECSVQTGADRQGCMLGRSPGVMRLAGMGAEQGSPPGSDPVQRL